METLSGDLQCNMFVEKCYFNYVIEVLFNFVVETLFNLVVEVLFHLCDLKIIQRCF